MKKARKTALALAALLLLAGCTPQGIGDGGVSTSANGASVSAGQGGLGAAGESGQSGLKLEDLAEMPMAGKGEWVEAPDGTKWFKNTGTFYDTFDTVIQFISYTETEEEFQKYFDLVHAEYQRLHKLYDNYKVYDGVTNLMSLNQEATKAPVKVDADLFSMIQFAKDQYEKTLGNVNIALGAPLMLWHDAREAAGIEEEDGAAGETGAAGEASEAATSVAVVTEEEELEGALPDRAALEEAAKHTKIEDVVLDASAQTVFLKDPKLMLDAGAVAKGYATEVVAKRLQEAGFAHGILSAGGNIKTIGEPVDGRDAWTVGIAHPRPEEEQVLATVKVRGTNSMVTSGDYQRYFMVDGVRYHHIIDPETLMPSTPWISVSIRTPDSGLADVLSTALFIADAEEAKTILANYADAGVDAIWVNPEMEVSQTDGMSADVTLMK